MKVLVLISLLVSGSAFAKPDSKGLSAEQAGNLKVQCTQEFLSQGAPVIGALAFCDCVVDKLAPAISKESEVPAWLSSPAGQAAGKECSDKANAAMKSTAPVPAAPAGSTNENNRSSATQRPSNKCYESVSVGKNKEKLVEVNCPVVKTPASGNGGVRK